MYFGILGAVEARRADGSAVALGGPRVRALLALLVLDAGRMVGTERLVDGLYGEHPPAGAVSRLRRAFGPDGGLLEFTAAGYRLAVDPETADLHRFTRLARAGHDALAADPETAAAQLDEALALWRGPALADVSDAPFAPAQAARLADLRLNAQEDRAEARLALGRHHDLVPELRELAAAEPLRERLHGLLIRALHADGRSAEALAAYEALRRTLAAELGADPSPALAALHLAILRAGARTSGGSPKVLGAPAVRVPARLTSFVGRDEELAQVGKLLAAGRLVTLLGPGGTGKTRLAMEAGARMEGEVCFVDLAPVTGAVGRTVLTALGVRESGFLPGPGEAAADTMERLTAALAERRILIILDNCEHVVAEAAALAARMLAACPDLRILATSREALAITGEALCPLRPLALPEDGAEVAASPAVRLFEDRAAAADPGFQVNKDNAALVREVCEALDGLPLALELAAARLRTLPLAEVAARLGTAERFRLLSRGDRTAAPRHRTLRAVVEWSWELLSDAERDLAAKLTVFAGGTTLESAARVCGLDPAEADELLTDLTDKSLLQAVGGRYRMLVTIRAYCAERLGEQERERLRRAHAEYFAELAERAEPELYGGGQIEWLERLAAENADLQAALRWAVPAAPDLAYRLVGALSWYWWLRGQRGEGAEQAAELLESGPLPGYDEEYVLGTVKAVSAGAGPAGTWLDRAAPVMARIEGPLRHLCLTVQWSVTGGPGRVDPAAHLRQVGPEPWSQGVRALGEGFLGMFGGDPVEAQARFTEAYERFEAVGDRWGMANCLDPLAVFASWRGEAVKARALLDQAVGLVEEMGGQEELADLLTRRAGDLLWAGDGDAARADAQRARALYRRAGATAKLVSVGGLFGDIARRTGDRVTARREYETVVAQWNPAWFGPGPMPWCWSGWAGWRSPRAVPTRLARCCTGRSTSPWSIRT